MLVAGDTFRAGAVEQIDVWSKRVGCDIIYKDTLDAASVIFDGLTKAKEEGWDTIYKSLEGGAVFLGENYISNGQDTFYLQKFDVDGEFEGLYWHQYMQAVYGAFNEGNRVAKAYEDMGIKKQPFVFKIPVTCYIRNFNIFCCNNFFEYFIFITFCSYKS